jgi:hypothetical protein
MQSVGPPVGWIMRVNDQSLLELFAARGACVSVSVLYRPERISHQDYCCAARNGEEEAIRNFNF